MNDEEIKNELLSKISEEMCIWMDDLEEVRWRLHEKLPNLKSSNDYAVKVISEIIFNMNEILHEHFKLTKKSEDHE